ncbi:hypothetical protein ACH3XW_22150 [Acanthocheilonema viteae]
MYKKECERQPIIFLKKKIYGKYIKNVLENTEKEYSKDQLVPGNRSRMDMNDTSRENDQYIHIRTSW